jgi:hypothetical protein
MSHEGRTQACCRVPIQVPNGAVVPNRSKWPSCCGELVFTRAVRHGPTPCPSATGAHLPRRAADGDPDGSRRAPSAVATHSWLGWSDEYPGTGEEAGCAQCLWAAALGDRVERGSRARAGSGCIDHTRGHGWAKCRPGPLGRRDNAQAGWWPRAAAFRRRGDHDGGQPTSHGGLAPERGGGLGDPVTDPVAGLGGCSSRGWPDGDRVVRQVAARSTRSAWQRPCAHFRRVPVGAHGNGVGVHGYPGRAGCATASAVPPGSYPRGNGMDDARGLEPALAALPLALRCAGRGTTGSAVAMAALPMALVPSRATKSPLRGNRCGDRVPGAGRASTRPNQVALTYARPALSASPSR